MWNDNTGEHTNECDLCSYRCSQIKVLKDTKWHIPMKNLINAMYVHIDFRE
jgi:hypothetical protein